MKAAFFARPAELVAAELIGCEFLFNAVGGLIVETEAYGPADPASHSFGGLTTRNASMFGPSGRAYIYRSYGLHWCFNIVCEPGSAVLLRALQPTAGLALMEARRKTADMRLLCSGPGRLCQALGLTKDQDGLPLDQPPFELKPPSAAVQILTGSRIGITKGVETQWRFLLGESSFVSRRLPKT